MARAGSRDYFGGRPVLATERFDRRVIDVVDNVVRLSFSDRSMLVRQRADQAAEQ